MLAMETKRDARQRKIEELLDFFARFTSQ